MPRIVQKHDIYSTIKSSNWHLLGVHIYDSLRFHMSFSSLFANAPQETLEYVRISEGGTKGEGKIHQLFCPGNYTA